MLFTCVGAGAYPAFYVSSLKPAMILKGRNKFEKNYFIYKNALQNNPDILSIGASKHIIGRSWITKPAQIDQIKTKIRLMEIGENYFETIGFDLISGSSFNWALDMGVASYKWLTSTLLKQ